MSSSWMNPMSNMMIGMSGIKIMPSFQDRVINLSCDMSPFQDRVVTLSCDMSPFQGSDLDWDDMDRICILSCVLTPFQGG